MRAGERRADHRGRRRLADPLDRDAGLARRAGGRRCRHRGRGRPRRPRGPAPAPPPRGAGRDGRVDVLAGDDTVRAGGHHGRQVDAEVLGQLAHRRLGQRAVADGRRGRGLGRRGRRRSVTVDLGLDRHRRDLRGGRGLSALAGAAPGRGRGHAVTHQDRLAGRGLGLFLGGGGVRHGLLHRLGGGRRTVTDGHRDDRRTDVDRGALGEVQLAHHAVVGDGQFDGGLGRLDLAHHLPVGDRVTGLDVPLEDLGLGEALTHVGHLELTHGAVRHRRHAPLLSTPASGRRHPAPGPGRAGTPPQGGPAGTGRGSRRPSAPEPPGGRSSAP
ncbi:hypothetical protein STENM223S_11235 [Streptomyces tendae]